MMYSRRLAFIKRLLGYHETVGLRFSLISTFFKFFLRYNKNVPWAVHYTSTIGNPENIIRGKHVFPGDSPGMYINSKNGIIIGDYSNLGPNSGLISANHDSIDLTIHLKGKPIKIGKFCWVGMGAIILPEVELGDFTLVAAGAIVTKSFPDGYCVIGGNPAKFIKSLDKEACLAHQKLVESGQHPIFPGLNDPE